MSDSENKEEFARTNLSQDCSDIPQVYKEGKKARFENDYSMCVLSWNIAGKMFTQEFDISQMIQACNPGNPPDIIVFGFQEIIPLNFYSFIKNSEEPIEMENMIFDSLKQEFPELKYKAFINESLMGLSIICFCKSEIREKINHVKTSIVKTGFKGYVGNKGCAAARFIIDDISVVLGCCHLDCGAKHSKARIDSINNITTTMFSEHDEGYSFFDHDVKILFGDLNFRVDIPFETAMDMIDFFDDK